MLERNRSGILMHFYLPSLILCLASTLSLFIHQDLWPARMSLCVTSCLSLITLIMGAKDSWPVTPYVKSIGYWALMCYCLVFYCILEYCVILSLKKTVSNIQTRNSMDLAEESNEEKRIRIVFNIEKISRICVPIYLLSFSVGYFIFMSHM